MLQGQVHHLLSHLRRNAIPYLARIGAVIDQPVQSILLILPVPTIKGAARHIQLVQRAFHRQARMFHQVEDLALFRFITPDHSSHGVSLPSKLFLSTRFFKDSSATIALS